MITGLLVMMNNYFHDLASGLLLCSAVMMFALLKWPRKNPSADAVELYIYMYEKAAKFAKFSLIWIVLGGVVRTIAYRSYEWSDAAGRGQIPALAAKHVFFALLLGLGIYYWVKLGKAVRELRGSNGGGGA